MVSVERSYDYPLLRTIFVDEDVWWRIADDERPEDFEVPEGMIYLLARVEGKPAGVFVIHEPVDGSDSHIQILPEFRQFKYEIGAAVLREAAEYTPRITTDIPKAHPNVHHYALKNDYTVIGEDENNWYYERRL